MEGESNLPVHQPAIDGAVGNSRYPCHLSPFDVEVGWQKMTSKRLLPADFCLTN